MKEFLIVVGILFFGVWLQAQVTPLPIRVSVLKSDQLKKLPPRCFPIVKKYEAEVVLVGENAFLERPKSRLPYIIGDGVQYIRTIPKKTKPYNFPLKGTPAYTTY